MSPSVKVRIAAGLAFLGIVLGAFGAHGLADRLEQTGRIDNWETATFYHLVHAIAMFVVALRGGRCLGYWWFFAGIILFSGSLYALALSDVSKLGAIAPLGGISFLVAWARWIFDRQSSSSAEP